MCSLMNTSDKVELREIDWMYIEIYDKILGHVFADLLVEYYSDGLMLLYPRNRGEYWGPFGSEDSPLFWEYGECTYGAGTNIIPISKTLTLDFVLNVSVYSSYMFKVGEDNVFVFNGQFYLQRQPGQFGSDFVYFNLVPLTICDMIVRYNLLVGVVNQSGEETLNVKYGKLKRRKKYRNRRKKQEKLLEVEKQLESLNLGSRNKHVKKNFKKKLKTAGIRIKQQSGVESYIPLLEKLVGLLLLKYSDKPLFVAISSILLIFRGSLCGSLITCIRDAFSCVKNKSCTFNDFVNWVKSLCLSVKTFKENKYASSFFEIVSKLISYFVCPSLCGFFDRITNNNIISNMIKYFTEGTNPLESLVNSFFYLINGIQVFINTGTMDGFIETKDSNDYSNEMNRMRSNYSLYQTGDLEFVKNYKSYEFSRDLEKLLTDLEDWKKSRKGFELKQTSDWISELLAMQNDLERIEKHANARIQPYHFILTSGSGIGKSNITKLICNTIAIRNNIPHSPEYYYYLNQSDPFQSGFKNYVTIIMADDSAAMMSASKTNNSLDMANWRLRSSNNVVHNLLGAHLHEKGKLFNRCLIEGWSSNSFDQEYHATARFPSAVNRRTQLRIIGKVRPEYLKDTSANVKTSQIDFSKLSEEQKEEIAPDAWLFDCYECEISDAGIKVKTEFGACNKELDNDYRFVRVRSNLDIGGLLSFVAEHSANYFKMQQSVLYMDSKIFDDSNYCSHGIPKNIRCNKCHSEELLRHIKIKKSKFVKVDKFQEVRHKVHPVVNLLKNDIEYKNKMLYQYLEDAIYSVKDKYRYIIKHICTPYIPADRFEFKKKDLRVYYKNYYFRNIDSQYPRVKKYVIRSIRDASYDYFHKAILDLNLGYCVQSGFEREVTYFKPLLDAIKNMKINDIFENISSVETMMRDVKILCDELCSSLATWADQIICDIVRYVLGKIVYLLWDFVKKPSAFIPAFVEGTVFSAVAYSYYPCLRAAMAIDYSKYLMECTTYSMIEPDLVSTVQPTYDLSNYVFNSFIRTPTKEERAKKARRTPLTFDNFTLKGVMKMSLQEKFNKEDNPDVIRDILGPLIGSIAFVNKIFPKLQSGFAKLYFTTQVGYEVTVDDIAKIDSKESKKWWLTKTEMTCTPTSVDKPILPSELENLVTRNLFYVRNPKTLKVICSLSICNKFLIFPYHYAIENIGQVIQLLKVEITDMNCPGNSIVEFQLTASMIHKMTGDSCIIYVEKDMDHMRTKDLLGYLPDRPQLDKIVGKLIWKEALGKKRMANIFNAKFVEEANNENIGPTQTPKNPFPGYLYECDNFEGLCGAVLIDEYRKNSHIVSIHVGGNTENRIGLGCFISREEVDKAILRFEPRGLVKQSGFSSLKFNKEIHSNQIYEKNPFYDTVPRIDSCEILGSIPNRVTPTSRVVYTPICDDVRKMLGVNYQWTSPPFKYNFDKRHGARSIIKQVASRQACRHMHLLRKSVEDYREAVMTPFNSNPDFWKKELRLLDKYEMVNGVAGKRFLGSMNMSTSFSSHYPGTKSSYAVQDEDLHWHFDDFVWEEFDLRREKMSKRWLCHEFLTQMLKNEAIPVEKAALGKVRSFYMSDVTTQLVLRQYLLTTCRYFCLNCKYTECSVGINPHSTDWHKMYSELVGFRKTLGLIALDLVSFDLTSLIEIVFAAVDILFEPIISSGNLTEEDLNIVDCLKHTLKYSIVNVNGDLVVLHGIIPSGSNVTSILGCIVNSLNWRMAYYYYNSEKNPKRFRENVYLRTFGDDSIANADVNCRGMTVKGVLDAWNDIGIPGSDAEKNKLSRRRYYALKEIEFLKRKFVVLKEFGICVAPLDLKSMAKCLSCHIPPKVMTIEAVTGQCVDNFLFEAKFHGRKLYEKWRKGLIQIVKKHDLEQFCSTLDLTFDDQVELWKEGAFDEEQITSVDEPKLLDSIRHFLSNILVSPNWSEQTQSLYEFNKTEDQNQSVVKLVALDGAHLSTQSGIEQEENLQFVAGNISDATSIGDTVENRIDEGLDLQSFFSRPVRIADWNWGNTRFSQTIDPWFELLTNKRISNRMSNYMLFSGKCKVKAVINGNGFYSGKILMSYMPLNTSNQFDDYSLLVDQGAYRLTQLPHVMLDPTTSTGGEMTLPFFYPKDLYNLVEDIGASDSNIGTLYFYELVPLRHANASISATLSNVSITLYAWFEDVVLESLTQSNINGISPQSGKEKTKNKKKPRVKIKKNTSRESESNSKPISQAATAVAKVANIMSRIPFIAPYALAVEQGASLTSKVASALGYCKPNEVAEPQKVTPKAIENTAVVNSTDQCNKLALDVKQQLSIDSRSCGLDGVDELSLAFIASRESYFTKFLWADNTAVGTNLQTIRVTPFTTLVDGNKAHITALAGTVYPFRYWTGTIVYKFYICNSAFHRGRLLVTYDADVPGSPEEENVKYSEVIDISECREFEIHVSNHAATAWLIVNKSFSAMYQVGTFATSLTGTNGMISISVLNQLTTPGQDPLVDTDINIVCTTFAGDDFQVAVPSGGKTAYISPQSGTENADDIQSPNETQKLEIVNPMKEYTYVNYMGEKCESFRALLKRYVYYGRVGLPVSGTNCATNYMHQMHPLYANDTLSYGRALANQPNLCGYTLLNYLMPCYAGMKGSIRWKIWIGNNNADFIGSRGLVMAIRQPSGGVYPFFYNTVGSVATQEGNNLDLMNEVIDQPYGGLIMNTSRINEFIEFEIPFQSQYSFVPARFKRLSEISQTGSEPYSTEIFRILTYIKPNVRAGTVDTELLSYCAAGEDFNLMFFTGFPPMYFIGTVV